MRLVDDWQSDEKRGLSGIIAEAVQPRGVPERDLRYVGSGGSEKSGVAMLVDTPSKLLSQNWGRSLFK